MVKSLQHINGEMVRHTARALFADEETTYQHMRSSDRYAHESDEALRELAQDVVETTKSDAYEVNTNEKWAVGMAIRVALAAAPSMAGRDWRVVHRASEKQSFITCDAPVYLTSRDPRPSVYGTGYASPEAFMSFPLHQSCVLEMWGDGGSLSHVEVDRDYIRMANTHFAKRCQRFVVGRDEALVKSLADEVGLAKSKWRPKFKAG